MGPQAQAFFEGESREWLKRNKAKLPVKDDPVLNAIKNLRLKPAIVSEIGCADGWRLKALRTHYGCRCYGIDPGIAPPFQTVDNIELTNGTASDLGFLREGKIDLLIYGFCLYLCDPEDYFKIASEGDRVLANGGHLVVYDFWSPLPYKKPYEHKKGLFSHKMDFAKLWTWNPAYSVQSVMMIGEDDECTAVQILRKNLNTAFRRGPPSSL